MIGKNKIKQLSQSKFVRNVLIAATGTAMAQVLGVVFTPIITRLYGPEAFGLMGTFVSLGTIAASITALSYPFAIVLPKKDSEAKSIVKLSIYISIVITFFAILSIIIAGDRLFALLGAQAIAAFALLIPLKMLFSAWLRIAQQWFIRNRQFKTKAKIEVLQTFLVNSSQTVIGLFKPLAAVLILLSTLGVGLHVLLLSISNSKIAKAKQKIEKEKKQTKESITQVAKKYYDFPLYRAPVVLIDSITTSLPVLMLSAFFGPVSAGFYVLGVKLLKAPTKLIGRSVSDVFYPKITKAAHEGKDIRRLIINTTLGLAAIGFLPYAAVSLFGPWIFKLVFGAEWVTAGEYAQWVSFMIFFYFISRPSVVATATLRLQRGFLIFSLFSTTIQVGALYIGFKIYNNDVTAVALFSISGAVSYTILMYWLIISSKMIIRKGKGSDISV